MSLPIMTNFGEECQPCANLWGKPGVRATQEAEIVRYANTSVRRLVCEECLRWLKHEFHRVLARPLVVVRGKVV